ncbi:hypothetical protein FB567DRAFT_67116 [Paraphoma chrysanthemicola]|uniref:Dolichyl-diphosphooligosaccharide-protein glycosyltransferase subunit OST5 n=1 Tax=Paraphoma chrysanthemicola TaxID=798071 RepID=A0A8K0VYD6_9PLEO|nr:hypothetical protein FB567DRAFT_67116 [Paraphoma chrysanthemicola]
MSSPLLDVWEAASGSPYYPAVGKNTQFTVGFVLLFLSLILGAVFGLSTRLFSTRLNSRSRQTDRSFTNLPLLGVPASIAFGFGAVYMICAVGVYV